MKEITSLSRGGSDATAVALAAGLDATRALLDEVRVENATRAVHVALLEAAA